MRRLAALLAITLLVALVPGLGQTSAGGPMVEILSPTEGELVLGPDVTFVFQVTSFTLSQEEIGMAPVPGRGHMHIYLDGMFKGTVASTTFTLPGLSPGMHTVKVDLHE
ncbi:MAG: Ig-like domain-containing protein, partial [Chloroflexi bacterium]|nr:Ig-like domain-containing protein [Chloroflexota bacterium]